MKKIIIAILFAAAVVHAGEIDWKASWDDYASGTNLIINGTQVFDDWVAGLYQSTGTNPGEGFDPSDLSLNFLAQSQALIDTSGPEPTWAFDLALSSPNIADNIPIYTVLFNTTNSDIFVTTPALYSYLIIDDTGSAAHDSGNAGVGFGNDAPYDVSVVSANNSWQAVPEPATVMLLILGGGLAAGIARLKRPRLS